MKQWATTRSGFTIVELLVVIVVIGILASVTVVGFNGVTARTENTKTISAVREWMQVLTAYATQNGDYPYVGNVNQTQPYAGDDQTISENYPCLGEYPNNRCASVNNVVAFGAGHAIGNSTWNDLIRDSIVSNSLPQPSTQDIVINGQPHRGAFLNIVNYAVSSGPQANGPGIAFYLTGGASSCPATLYGRPITVFVGDGGVRCSVLLPSFK